MTPDFIDLTLPYSAATTSPQQQQQQQQDPTEKRMNERPKAGK
jgi:hypothetical protein